MKGDLDKDGVLNEYEQARQDAIDANMRERKALGGIASKIATLLSRRNKLEKELMTENMSKKNQDITVEKIDEIDKEVKNLEKEIDRDPQQQGGKLVGNQKKLDVNNDGKLDADDFSKLRSQKQEGGSMDDQMMMVMNVKPMMPDEEMEDNYTQFIMEEALSEKEEEMLMSKLEQDEELAMLFDKVIDVAQEFAGSGPVEGPGSGVSDSIPARLSDGEFVFTAKATEEIGADELMRMMKDAEAAADKRQGMQTGGPMEEEETMTMQNNEPVTQEIRVVKETVDSAGRMMEDEDEISKDIKSQMMLDPNQRHVRS